VSISLPANSAGLFGVPKINVAQVIYQAILKFNETKGLIYREFAWWFGGLPNMSNTNENIIPQKSDTAPLLFI